MAKIIFSDFEKKMLIDDMQEKIQNETGKKVSKAVLKDALAAFTNGECYWLSDHAPERFEDWCKNVERMY